MEELRPPVEEEPKPVKKSRKKRKKKSPQKKPRVKPRNIIEWIFENWDNSKAAKKDAPSSGAWSLFNRLRERGDAGYWDFMNKMFLKIMPSKVQSDRGDDFADYDRDIVEALDELDRLADGEEQSVLHEMVQDVEGPEIEPGLPPEAVAVGRTEA